jgi:hypothetical protein
MKKSLFLTTLLLLFAACGDNLKQSGESDAAQPADASPAADASTPADGSPADAGDIDDPDAAPLDAAPPAPSFVYWANLAGTIGRANIDGSAPGDIVTGLTESSRVAIDAANQKIFYGGGEATITQADLDGSNPVAVVPTGASPSGMAIDATNGKLYWSTFTTDSVLRADLDGSNVETILDGNVTDPSGIWIDEQNGKLYVITYNTTQIRRANLDGSGLETVAASLGGQGVEVIVDPTTQTIYYSQRGAEIRTMSLDGSNQATLISGQATVQGMAVDFAAGKLYWTASGVIRRADLADGANIEDIVDTGVNVWGIGFLPPLAP